MNHNTSIFPKSLLYFFFSIITVQFSAQHYWVGGTGDWSDYANHWATTSGGSTFHMSEPTLTDDVFFDSNSFTTENQVVTLDLVSNDCNLFDCSGVQYSPTFNSEQNFITHGSTILSSSAVYNFDNFFLQSINFGNTITSNGAYLGDNSVLHFNSDGEFILNDDLSCGTFFFQRGTFDTNGNDMNVNGQFFINGAGTKELNLGSSNIYCDTWRANGQNFTLNAGTSTIHVSTMKADENGAGPYDYHNVTFLEGDGILYNTSTFNTINASGTAGHFFKLQDQETITCENFILEATRQNDCHMFEGYTWVGTAYLVVNSGSAELSFVRMGGIHVSGGSNFNVNPGEDLGNNDGWSFTDIVPLNYYWVGDGGNWNDLNHWSSTSGGAPNYSFLSSRYDNIYFDNNSFSDDNQTLILNYDCIVKNLDFSGLTNNLILNAEDGGQDLIIHANLIISDLVDKDLNAVYFYSTTEASINFGILGTFSSVVLENGGQYTIQSDLSCSSFRASGAVVNTNGYTINSVNTFYLQNGIDFTNEFGSSDIFCRDFKVWNENINLDAGTSTIYVQRKFTGASNNYNHVILEDETFLSSIYDDNTFVTLEIVPGIICEIEAGTIQSVDNLILNGTGSLPINIGSTEEGEQATFSKSSGTVNATFVSLQDNNATGGAVFNALQAVDFGNNTGWNITELQPNDFYWVGGSGNWTDYANHWATTSGGSSFYTYTPGVIDNVFFDGNSFNSVNQIVTVDSENINCNTMDWTGATNNPHLSGEGKILNIYGSLIFNENMTSDLSSFNFLGEGVNSISTSFDNSPGIDSDLNFLSSGVWNINGDLTAFKIDFHAGTLNTNGYSVEVVEDTDFYGVEEKTLNLGASTYATRDFRSVEYDGDNLTVNGESSTIECSGVFIINTEEGVSNMAFINNLHFVLENNSNLYLSESSINVLTIDTGISLFIEAGDVITVNQLIAEGTPNDLIELKSSSEGNQATISQASGTVNGEYLLIQDIAAIGGATFFANNSIDNGNVDGWIFTGLAQSISFMQIDDVVENIGSFILEASSTSGLSVVFNVIDGPATIEGNTITITGAGTIEVEAIQIGDDDYNPAAPVEIEFCSNPIQPIISGDLDNLFITLSSSSEVGNYWYLDNELLGQFNQSFQTVENGSYTVQITIDGCLSELSEAYLVLDLSLDEFSINELMTTYPNPTTGLFYFTIPNNEKANIELYNSLGKLVYSHKSVLVGATNNSIDISSFNEGIYFLVIQTKTSKYFSKIRKG